MAHLTVEHMKKLTPIRPNLLVLFNHTLTDDQIEDARLTLAVGKILEPPAAIVWSWAQIPANLERLADYLGPIRDWLTLTASSGDYVLVQGDYGATYLMAMFALEKGYIPIYSTTIRQANEERLAGGEVRVTHDFRHRIFRCYGH